MSSTDRPLVLILGGARYQVPVVRAAQAAGLRTAVLDASPNVPARELADMFENIDTRNRDAVTEFASRAKVSGIMAPCTDAAVSTQAHVAKRLGLPGPPLEAAEILSNKTRFRALLGQLDLAAPNWQSVDCGHPEGVILEGGLYVLKPTESSGSKGAYIVDAKSFAARLCQTRPFCLEDRAIVEEFIDGHQGTVEGIWRDKEFELAAFTDRMTAPAPYVATIGHRIPSGISAEYRRQILEQIGLIFGYLSVEDCLFDCDFVIGPQGAHLIELTPRLGGNSMSKLLLVATGVDLVSVAIWLSLAPEARATFHSISTKPTREIPAAIILLGADRAGLLQFDEEGLADLRELDWVEEITLDVPKGAPISQFTNGRERIGEALITGASQELNERMAYVKRKLAISAIPVT